jgi:hypothetical protein
MLAEVFQNAVTLESPLSVFQRLAKIAFHARTTADM